MRADELSGTEVEGPSCIFKHGPPLVAFGVVPREPAKTVEVGVTGMDGVLDVAEHGLLVRVVEDQTSQSGAYLEVLRMRFESIAENGDGLALPSGIDQRVAKLQPPDRGLGISLGDLAITGNSPLHLAGIGQSVELLAVPLGERIDSYLGDDIAQRVVTGEHSQQTTADVVNLCPIVHLHEAPLQEQLGLNVVLAL